MTFEEKAKSTFPNYMKSEGNILRLYSEIFLSLVSTTKELGKNILYAFLNISKHFVLFVIRLFTLITLPIFFILIFWMEWKAIKANYKARMKYIERMWPTRI